MKKQLVTSFKRTGINRTLLYRVSIIFLIVLSTHIQKAQAQYIKNKAFVFTDMKVDNHDMFVQATPKVRVCAGKNKTITVSFRNVLTKPIHFTQDSLGSIEISTYLDTLGKIKDNKKYFLNIASGTLAPNAVYTASITTTADFSLSGYKGISFKMRLITVEENSVHFYAFDSIFRKFVVADLPSTNISAPSKVCVGTPVTLTASNTKGRAPFMYLFHPNNEGYTTFTASNQTVITPTTSGQKSWNVTVKDANGCVYTDTIRNQIVVPSPTAQIFSFSPAPMCAGSFVILSGNGYGGTPIPDINYYYSISLDNEYITDIYRGNTPSSSPYNVQASIKTSGIKKASVRISDLNGCTSTVSANITVNSLPVTTLTASVTSACVGKSFNLIAKTTAGKAPFNYEYNYKVDPNQGYGYTKSTSNQIPVTPKNIGAGSLIAYVDVTDNNGCTYSSRTHGANAGPLTTEYLLHIPVTVCAPTSRISDTDTESLATIYPNPSADKFNLNLMDSIQIIKVSDQMGRVVYHSTAGEKSIDLSGHPQGVYILQVTTEKGETSIHRIEKQ